MYETCSKPAISAFRGRRLLFFRAQGASAIIGRVKFVHVLMMLPCRALITG